MFQNRPNFAWKRNKAFSFQRYFSWTSSRASIPWRRADRRLLNRFLVEAGGDVCELLSEPGLRVAVRDVHEGGRRHLLYSVYTRSHTYRVFTKFRILEISWNFLVWVTARRKKSMCSVLCGPNHRSNMAETPQPPPPAFGLIYEALLVSQSLCNTLVYTNEIHVVRREASLAEC